MTTVAPAKGKRPRNRRALILAAAADLFYRDGYARVTMADVAAAVSVGPSALYRHFRGKAELLVDVVVAGVEPFEQVEAGEDMLAKLAVVAVQQRQLGVLWQRETRHLPAADRRMLRHRLRNGMAAYARHLRANRDLSPTQATFLALATFGMLTSISYHRLELPHDEYARLLTELGDAIARTDLPDIGSAPRESTRLAARSRREALLATAAVLFADNGYATASLRDIGAGVDIAGPSIYHHFDSKLELLVAVMNRGAEWLRMDLARALAAASGAADALSQLIRSYAGFALEHRELVDVLVTEVAHLPEPERHRARQTQHDYVSEWVHLVRSQNPALDDTCARIRVQAVLAIVNDIARTPRLRHADGIADALHAVGTAVLR
ncbi:TetR/AcrR family transcriptional regulator [Fodinicola acaciae]|uniref:TetR/AcrR family transcriptional regulator n=1 Tax=Fodinicola acaciae TaxID=2681555 RepID=UPI001C9E42D9|nr:TetR/AcrR family transcriptional regulator [Fodinicola acaciae]